MRRLVLLAGLLSVLALLSGCQEPNKVNGVSLDNGGEFPEYLAGTWKADKHDWAIRFESDGSISLIVHTLWALPIRVEEGGVYIEGKEPGTFALFVIGECEADYNPGTRELSAKTILEAFEIKMPEDIFKGKSEDYFDGTVSEDGKIWQARWRGYAYMEGASPPDVNYIDAHPEPLIFTKIQNQESGAVSK